MPHSHESTGGVSQTTWTILYRQHIDMLISPIWTCPKPYILFTTLAT